MKINEQINATEVDKSTLENMSVTDSIKADKIVTKNSSSSISVVKESLAFESETKTGVHGNAVTYTLEGEFANDVEQENYLTGKVEHHTILNESEEILSKISALSRTASLWSYIQIPEDDPAPTKDIVCDVSAVSWGEVIAARVRGKNHKHKGTNCDDWYEVRVLPEEEAVCIAVSDGIGSCDFSRIGSKVSCGTAVDCLARQIHETYPNIREKLSNLPATEKEIREVLVPLVTRAAFHAKNAVVSDFIWFRNKAGFESLKEPDADYNKMAATLLLVVLIPVNDKFLTVSFQVGDGIIALVNSHAEIFDKTVTLLGYPDRGEFAGQTLPLTSLGLKELEIPQRTTMVMHEKFDTLLIMTDGVADDFLPDRVLMDPHVPELMSLYFSLIANGVIPSNCLNEGNYFSSINLPPALSFPNPKNNNVVDEVPINYIWRILDTLNLSLKDLWQNQEILSQVASELQISEEKIHYRLASWLDNYVEKGSFDDRTLVIVRRN